MRFVADDGVGAGVERARLVDVPELVEIHDVCRFVNASLCCPGIYFSVLCDVSLKYT